MSAVEKSLMTGSSMVNIRTLTQNCYTVVPVEATLKKMARLYADVFADPPWNEYKVCEGGDHYYGREAEELTVCQKCKRALKIAYPPEQTVSYIADEVKKTEGTLVLFEDGMGEVLAAGWGYVCKIEDFKTKYRTPEMQKRVVNAIQINTPNDSIFYLSEVMVDKRARTQGIATKIARFLQEKAQQGNFCLIMRTHNDSPMAKIGNNLGMRRIIDLKGDSEMDGRILFLFGK